MIKKSLLALLILLTLFFWFNAQAAEMPFVYTGPGINLNSATPTFLDYLNKSQAGYADTPISKAGDGVLNVVSAWVDIPESITDESADSNLLTGWTIGLGKGVVSGVTRGAAGLVDFGTCAFPPYDKPMVTPEYTVNHPDRDGLKIKVLSW